MKEIGEKLKEARESIGVSLEEAATDLKTTEKQLNNIEIGNMEAFKDVLDLKFLIKEYAKYLGLNKEDIVDDFNEYLFDYTSKISLEDISNAKKNKEKEKEDKIQSPYTTIKEKKKINYVAIGVTLIVIICIVIIALYFYNIKKKKDSNIIAYNYVERR